MSTNSGEKRRIVIVGTGARCAVFIDQLVGAYRDGWSIVGLCDSNPTRVGYYAKQLRENCQYGEVPTFNESQFAAMIRQTRPDTVLVTTPDYLHHKYVIASLDLGCDVMCEKPLTTEPAHCRQIIEKVHQTGHTVRVTHNLRWTPGNSLVAELLRSGVVGVVKHVQMEYLLDLMHGADYFRRWHREKRKSGGLAVHKSSHHFDLVNWWLDDIPQEVFATGRLAFYGRENATRRGLVVKGNRYTTGERLPDPFALRLDEDEQLRALYLDAEKHDGYLRDQNVFSDGITTEDTFTALVKYRGGATFGYSLNAYSPREGYRVTICGDRGRLEFDETFGLSDSGGIDERGKPAICWPSRCIVHPMFQKPYEVEIPVAKGTHLGADQLLGRSLFDPTIPKDPLQREAGIGQGALAALVGMAANESIARGIAVNPFDLCDLGEAARLSDLDRDPLAKAMLPV